MEQSAWEDLRKRIHGRKSVPMKSIRDMVPEAWYLEQCRRKDYRKVRILLESSWNIEAYQPEIVSAVLSLQRFNPKGEDYVSLRLEGKAHLSEAEKVCYSERWFLY